ncbi:MAG: DUF819 family protein [bacterium]|nr:DUF819 family protein [bacterium]
MFGPPLISSGQNWLLLAILLSVALFGLWAEKTRWGMRLSGAVASIVGALILSNLSIIPSAAPVYDMVWTYFVPLAIPLLLFKANLRRIIRETGPTLAAFIIGGIGTVLGTLLAFRLIPLGPEGWKMAGIFCSTYIGGSMNYVATSQAVDLKSGDLMAAGIAADNLVMTIYFLVLFALPSISFLRKKYVTRRHENAGASINGDTGSAGSGITLYSIAKALALAAVICAIGYGLSDITGLRGTGVLFLTALTVLLATFLPQRVGEIAGADQLGTFFMQVFFAVIGASANITVVFKTGPILFVFAGLILLVHLLFLLVGGWLLKLDLTEIVIASNANMGGPTTAAAMAVARKWDALVIPAILCGTLGYAVATFIGVAVGYWLK